MMALSAKCLGVHHCWRGLCCFSVNGLWRGDLEWGGWSSGSGVGLAVMGLIEFKPFKLAVKTVWNPFEKAHRERLWNGWGVVTQTSQQSDSIVVWWHWLAVRECLLVEIDCYELRVQSLEIWAPIWTLDLAHPLVLKKNNFRLEKKELK